MVRPSASAERMNVNSRGCQPTETRPPHTALGPAGAEQCAANVETWDSPRSERQCGDTPHAALPGPGSVRASLRGLRPRLFTFFTFGETCLLHRWCTHAHNEPTSRHASANPLTAQRIA